MDAEKKEKILHDLKKISRAINELIKDLDDVGEIVVNERN